MISASFGVKGVLPSLLQLYLRLCDSNTSTCPVFTLTSVRRRSDFQSGGGGHQQKRELSGKRGTSKGKSQSEIYNFYDIGIYPYDCGYNIRDDFNICFSLYMLKHYT